MVLNYKKHSPEIDESVYVSESAAVTGRVRIAKNASVWFGAALRGDIDRIEIGEGSNIQDNATVHVGLGAPAIIGKNVTVGHNAVVHGAVIGDNCLIGMGSIILDKAVIGDNCIIGAGAVVTGGTEIPPGSLVLGCPAKVTKQLGPLEKAENLLNAKAYCKLAKEYKEGQK